MNRAQRRQLERQIKKPLKINKDSLEYREGIKEGVRRERGNWVQAMESTEGIGEVLSERLIGEVAKLYRG